MLLHIVNLSADDRCDATIAILINRGLPYSVILMPLHIVNLTIDAKCFRAITFGSDAREWCDWSFAFKRTLRSCSRDAFIMMDFVEKQSAEVQEHLLGGEGSGSVSPNVLSKLSAKL